MLEDTEGKSMIVYYRVEEKNGMLWLPLASAICIHDMYLSSWDFLVFC
jgi:hypothetical protein